MVLVTSNFKISDKFVRLIFESTSGFISVNEIEDLINLFSFEINKKYFTESSEANLFRIINSVFDKGTFLKDCLKYPHHVEIITSISSYSNFLTDVIVRNPSLLYLIFNPSNLEKDISQESIDKEISSGVNKFRSFDSKISFLRRFKREKLLIIGLNDILGNIGLKATTAHISFLAKGISRCLFELCYNEIQKRKKIKLGTNRFALAALGKLGGDELNYSSDIDLILFYDKNSIHGKSPQFTYQELLGEAAQLFAQTATELKSDGYIYRVDFRLRPDGKYAPICMAIGDYFRYYENRGAEWERQMLIKLSFVAGNIELYNEFNNYILHFIYPKTFLKSPLEQISKMKSEIEKKLSDQLNVKLFTGGIRDIEFSVQALQLLNGGKIKELRTGNSLSAIEALEIKNIIDKKESDDFKNAYIFYRKIEHFLQLMNDTQTHEIPKQGELTEKLSHYLKYNSVNSFIKDLEKQRIIVRKIFSSLLSVNDKKSPTKLNFTNFSDAQKAKRNFEFLSSGKNIFSSSTFDKRTVDAFALIKSRLFRYFEKSKFPDSTLENFTKITQAIKTPYFWFKELVDEKILNDILFASEFSKKFVDLLILKPNLVDLIFTRKIYTKDLTDLFGQMSKIQIEFILTFQYTLSLIDEKKLSIYLTKYFDRIINEKIQNKIKGEYFLAALGSYGTRDLTFSSDLDLIIVTEDKKFNLTNEKLVLVFLKEMREIIPTADIDFKLRPEGKSSNIVWDISAYEKYMSNRARVWEFQSLLKLRVIYGSNQLADRFKKSMINSICNSYYDFKIEILDMHKKLIQFHASYFSNKINIKNDEGGISTINFLMDYLLLNTLNKKSSLIGSSVEKKITSLISSVQLRKELRTNYAILKKIILMNETVLNNTKKEISQSLDGIEKLEYLLNIKTKNNLFDLIEMIKSKNKILFLETIN